LTDGRAESHTFEYCVIAGIAVLVGGLGFLDDLLEARRLSLVDAGLAIGLATLAFTGLLVYRRTGRSELRHSASARESADVLGAMRSISSPHHAGSVMDRLAEHACRALGLERSIVMARDLDDPAKMKVIAGHGIPPALFGTRWPIDQGMGGRVLASGKPLLVEDYQRLPQPLEHPTAADAHAGAAVPMIWGGSVRAALTVVTVDPDRRLGKREIEMLTEIGGLGALALEHAEMRERLEQTVNVGAQALAAAVATRDQYTAEHSESVVELAMLVGARLGFDEDALDRLETAARLHDIGKLAIPESILLKPGPLDEAEWAVMRQHPTRGAELLSQVPGMEHVAEIVRAEHERWDGRGYPLGLRGPQIPVEARIVFACDAFHAMTSDRPYRRALPREVALHELHGSAGSQFDPAVVESLLAVLDEPSRVSRRP
jgi:hypothetical protein